MKILAQIWPAALAVLLAGSPQAAEPPTTPAGSLPTGADGRPLNLDFETGTLRDWTATGAAFTGQPIHGDTVAPRRAGMPSGHRGEYWIGSYELAGDAPQGTLTSAPFKVTQPYAAFRVAGGNLPGTRVELVRADTGAVFFKVTGYQSETLRPVVADLREQAGREIFIRLVDEETGGWGHLNFDDFKLYAARPRWPDELDPARLTGNPLPPMDVVKFAGLSPEDAVKAMTLPPGFRATLFAGEPDVKQPIAFAQDHRGRLWVAEAYTYPVRAPEGQGKDRILVFEDTKGDGHFDKRTVFQEGLNLVSGLEVGFGGVWVGAAPYLLFIPIQDGDTPRPAGPPQILLDGWGYQDTHETLNTFTWGPDGWLYGCHGVFTLSKVGKPGAAAGDRTTVTAGVWRWHPTRREFEYFAEGTSNPWGVDFDEHGQCVIEACVIPHLWHMIQGGRYERQGGQHVNPYIFDDLKTIADHFHYAGDQGPHAGNGRSGALGGGHAHAGLMVYQGGSWPAEYRGEYFMNNIHGARINQDSPTREGSGFAGRHRPDFLNFNDAWSQILNLQYDHDGSVYLIDWYDKNQCHHNDPNGHDRSNGRIFKVIYGDAKGTPVNLEAESDDALARRATHPNEWHDRHARRALAERAQQRPLAATALAQLREYLRPDAAPAGPVARGTVALRALWMLHAAGQLPEAEARAALRHPDEYVRAWGVQLLAEPRRVSPAVAAEFRRLAGEEPSPVVRLYLAAMLQRLPPEERWETAAALQAHAEDAGDHNLPLMNWYAAEPLAAADPARALQMAEAARLPRLLQFAVRRVAALGTPAGDAAIAASLHRVTDAARQLEALTGLELALQGQRSRAMPEGWELAQGALETSPNPEIRAKAQSLSLKFGSEGALAALQRTLVDRGADAGVRRTALDSLLGVHASDLAPKLQQLLSEPALQVAALRGLAAYEDPQTPAAILAAYPRLDPGTRRDALNTLASRAAFARPLLAAVGAGTVPAHDLTADLLRQLRALKNPELEDRIKAVWGVARDSSADKQQEIVRYKAIYRAGGSLPGDAGRGRAVFARTCAQCHTLFDAGGKVGPNLTGSNRADLDYILQNIVDPNAVIPNEYRSWNIELRDDRSITGIVTRQEAQAITVVTPTEVLVLPRGEVRSLTQSELSMMPEGLLQGLRDQEVRDLIYYLGRPGQVPLPGEK